MRYTLLKKNLVFGAILLFICMSIFPSSPINAIEKTIIPTNRGKILYVGGNGPGNYSNIHDAIDDSFDGDTIFVYSGVYPGNIIIDKALTLIGENRDNTIIENSWDGIYIYADYITVTKFTIRNCGFFWNQNAIYVNSNDNVISSIAIIDNDKLTGIHLEDSNNNIITENFVARNPYFAILIEHSSNNEITNNLIVDNRGTGLSIVDSNYNLIASNIVSENFWGGITIGEYCEGNLIYHNNFIDNNGPEGYDFGFNNWNDSYPSGGNYWSDYIGVDNYHGPKQDIPGSDGIGDTPYDLLCEHSTDWYPFMNKYGAPNTPIITGNTNGKINVEYQYNFFVSDPDNDQLYLRVDWGSGNPGKWYGPFDSGRNIMLNYTWLKKGNYIIRAQVKDIYNIKSGWGTLTVKMPRNRVVYRPFKWFLENNPNLFSIMQLLEIL